ncbi:MAG: FAD-dependent monooxygenase [Paracoccaceae bacterium]|nr:FAD-dependent monooxygenase [Paracoccaceae bacterium]
MPTDPLNITVAGGGVAGTTVATALARDCHKVRLAEQAPAFEEVGAGLQVSPNGFCVIEALGLGEALAASAVRIERVRLIDGLTGRDVLTLDLKAMPWFAVHRADLIEMLVSAARDASVTLETGQHINPPPEGKPLDGDDLLIGADGLNSALRARIEDASKPFFTRQVAWRAVIEDDDGIAEVQVHMGPGRHLVSYPLTDGRRNIVAVEERTAWAEEGWSHADHPANLRAAFQRFKGPVPDWLSRVDQTFLWGLFRHPVAHRWHTGAQVLIGDAAHPTLPFLAQGANLALEDAWVLKTMLANHPVTEALPRYQAARRARVLRTVEAASRNARNYHLSFPPLRFAAHTGLRLASAIAPGAMLARFDWLYSHDVTKSTSP